MSLKSHILTFAQVYDPKSFHPDLEEFKQLSTSIQYVLVSANLYSAKLGLMRFFKLHYSNLFNKLLAKGPLRGPITLSGFLKIEGSEVMAFLG